MSCLLWGDAVDDTLLHPVHHVFLLHADVELLQRDLVVHAFLHLVGDHVESFPAVGLKKHCDIVLERERDKQAERMCKLGLLKGLGTLGFHEEIIKQLIECSYKKKVKANVVLLERNINLVRSYMAFPYLDGPSDFTTQIRFFFSPLFQVTFQ